MSKYLEDMYTAYRTARTTSKDHIIASKLPGASRYWEAVNGQAGLDKMAVTLTLHASTDLACTGRSLTISLRIPVASQTPCNRSS